VRAQFCRESCIQQERRFSADVTRAVGPARGQYLPNAPFEAVTRGADRRFWPFVLAAVLAALGALASGCVFPMIPLTITFFTKRAEENRARQVRYAAAYGGGIIFSFTVIGLVIAAIAGASGLNRLASNPWVNVGIGALFVLFGLSLLEIVNARMPSWLVRRVAGASGAARPGYLPVVMMGLLFTLTTFTCTFPFVGMLLVLAASGQWFWPALGMIVFSFTFAFPFFFLALFPGYLGRLPQAGQWMHRVKIAMSLVVMAFAFKFFCAADLVRGWGIFTRSVVLAVWCAMAIAEGLLLLGAIAIGEKRREEVGSGSLLSGVAFLALAAYLGSGLCGGRLHGVVEGFLPPCPEAAVAAPAKVDTGGTKAANVAGRDAVDTSAWFSDYVQAMRAAAGAGRNVFVNFTGITCVACRRMENTVFLDPQVRMVLEELVRAKLYVDLGTPESGRNAALQAEKFGSVALPLYAIVRPSDGTVLAILQGGDHTAEEFVEFLARGL
jgi:thiol:disulfide interchange protein DsbD